MKEIKMLAGHIREEMNDAETYAKLALRYKDDDRSLSQTFEKLAEQELDHADMLHAQASRLIKERKEIERILAELSAEAASFRGDSSTARTSTVMVRTPKRRVMRSPSFTS